MAALPPLKSWIENEAGASKTWRPQAGAWEREDKRGVMFLSGKTETFWEMHSHRKIHMADKRPCHTKPDPGTRLEKHMLNKLLDILSVSIMALNFGAGIVGGIWLAFLAQWKLIGIGIFLLFTSPWILMIFMIPGIPIAGIAARFYPNKSPLGYLFGFLSQLYTNILIVGTCVISFYICSSFYKGNVGLGYIPFLLWSWGMALGPWQFFASKEPDNEYTALTLFSASVFYFLFIASVLISPLLGLIVIGLFGVVQLIVLPIINMRIAYKI